ncbi:MAG: hypothetical protein ACW98X_24725 [Promethearchaeota archaeon]|jgi:hypothetical protein
MDYFGLLYPRYIIGLISVDGFYLVLFVQYRGHAITMYWSSERSIWKKKKSA